MTIKNLLLNSGSTVEIKFEPEDFIFREDSPALFYFFIVEGTVKLNNYSDEGKKFIQDILSEDSSLGVSMLLLERPYPVNAIAMTDCVVLKIRRAVFIDLINSNCDGAFALCLALSEKIYDKYIAMRKLSSRSAIQRITELMDVMKSRQEDQSKFSFEVPHTRQQTVGSTCRPMCRDNDQIN